MNRSVRIASGLVLGSLLLGCGGSGTHFGEYPRVRVFNGVDAQPSVAVQFKDSAGNSLGTTAAVTLDTISATDAIFPNTNATATFIAGGVSLFAGASNLYRINSRYSLYFGGVAGNYASVTLNDNQGLGPTAGAMDVRAVHVGAKSPAVDIFIVPVGAGATGPATFSNLAFGTVASSKNASTAFDSNGYTTQTLTPRAAYQVLVTAHNSTAVLASAPAIVGQQIYYTLVVYDSGTGTGVQIFSDRH